MPLNYLWMKNIQVELSNILSSFPCLHPCLGMSSTNWVHLLTDFKMLCIFTGKAVYYLNRTSQWILVVLHVVVSIYRQIFFLQELVIWKTKWWKQESYKKCWRHSISYKPVTEVYWWWSKRTCNRSPMEFVIMWGRLFASGIVLFPVM